MFIVRRLLTYINPLIFWGGVEFLRYYPRLWWAVLLLMVGLLTFTIWDFSKREFNKRLLAFLLSPLILLLSSFVFIVFLENLIILRVVCAISAVLLFLTIDQTLNYFYFTSKYQPYTLENLALYNNIISFFYFSSALFSALIFLRLMLLLAVVLIYLVSFLLIFQILWISKIDWSKAKIFCVIIPLMLTELFVALTYLPLSFHVNALLLATGFYFFVGLSRLFLAGTLNRRNVLTHVLIASVLNILILITAQWS